MKFKIGDKIKLIKETSKIYKCITINNVYEVLDCYDNEHKIVIRCDCDDRLDVLCEWFKLAKTKKRILPSWF